MPIELIMNTENTNKKIKLNINDYNSKIEVKM